MTQKRFESHDNIILDAEGEPLKSIDEIVDVLNELDGENDFLYDNIIKFEKENEELKEFIKSQTPSDLYVKFMISLSNKISNALKMSQKRYEK